MESFKSRKFIVTIIQTLLMVALPLVYNHLGISNEITMTVLIAIGAAGSFYTGFNVLQKKIESSDES